MTEPRKPPSRRWFVPQFSLRALLIVVTLSAIGTALWYRLPFEEETDLYAQLSPAAKKRITPQKMRATREVKTYRRVWGGERVLHGWTRRYHANGQLVFEEQWREGVRHGPSRRFSENGDLELAGSFFNGKKDGDWKVCGNAGAFAIQHWNRGNPHGAWQFHDASGVVSRTISFHGGKVARIDGKAFDDPLTAKRMAGKIDNQGVHAALMEDGMVDFVQTPLKDVVTYLKDAHGVPIEMDAGSMEEQGISVDLPVTENLERIPLSIILAVILEPHGLVADYRFGVIMICPGADAENWRDPTGVSEVKPRPDSALARQWEQPVGFEFVETGLTDVMRYITNVTGVPIEVAVEKPFDQVPITRSLSNLSLKNSLGIVCDDCYLHVRQDGDRLVIELLEDVEGANP